MAIITGTLYWDTSIQDEKFHAWVLRSPQLKGGAIIDPPPGYYHTPRDIAREAIEELIMAILSWERRRIPPYELRLEPEGFYTWRFTTKMDD